MGENIPPHQLYHEYSLDLNENESAPFEQVISMSEYAQPMTSFGHLPCNELLPSHQDLPNSNLISGQRSLNPKVPIPRTTLPVNYTNKGRVGRACENCREQKAKFSGHRPSCHRCQNAGVPCSYGDRKREKMLKFVSCIWRSLCIVG